MPYKEVIGSSKMVKLGSRDELRYFRVMSKNGDSKTFYLSPSDYPGYDDLMNTLDGRKLITDFYERLNDIELSEDYEII